MSVVCVTLYHLPGALSSRSVECAITFRIFMMPRNYEIIVVGPSRPPRSPPVTVTPSSTDRTAEAPRQYLCVHLMIEGFGSE